MDIIMTRTAHADVFGAAAGRPSFLKNYRWTKSDCHPKTFTLRKPGPPRCTRAARQHRPSAIIIIVDRDSVHILYTRVTSQSYSCDDLLLSPKCANGLL